MWGLIRKFFGSQRGSIGIMAAICTPVLVGGVGVAIDYVSMARITTQMQSAADSAALAGVKELSLSGSNENHIKAVIKTYVADNFGETPGDSANGGSLSIKTTIVRGKNTVEVALEKKWVPFFLHFVSNGITPIKVHARAGMMGQRLACVIGLSKLAPPGVQLWKDASLVADGCDVYSNTALPTGLVVSDSATLKASLICVSGGYVALRPSAVAPPPLTDCPAFEDPLAARQPPKVGGCDYLATIILNQNRTLNPGVYCGGLIILGNSRVKLNPGVYTIANGLFTVAGSASMTGENVGFYLAGLETLMLFDSDSTIDLTAPKDGPLAGILFFEDRKAPPLRIHRIGSNNARNLLGTIYLPVGILLVDANAPVADNSAYTAIVVRSLQLREGPKLVLHSDYQDTNIPVPDGLIGVRAVLTN